MGNKSSTRNRPRGLTGDLNELRVKSGLESNFTAYATDPSLKKNNSIKNIMRKSFRAKSTSKDLRINYAKVVFEE